MLINTIWANDSSDRIVRMIGFRITNLFLLKCLMKNQRKITVFVILLATMFYYTIIIIILESPLYYFKEINQ